MTKSIMVPSTKDFKHWEFVAQDTNNFHLNHVSKRRVPNGPDPIHNRRAAKSRQPPGRA
ncbi:CLAVATA3/ESR (CLE)-related protein 25-like protein [Corchorus olitorius]|uniref:CLAVATA3/ESR (CLE)-related protein 25-like protein n=1 Tax=Corchorus olitorius TaxID=93759 RepID=A0A1R3G3X6_9ROSI|nr:CLAVATA3/ESR (CLE)-related protein 25-like protein [Corchorus olitorius]